MSCVNLNEEIEKDRICDKCEINYPINYYRKYEIRFGITCKKCLNELDKARKQKLREKKAEGFVKCEICQEEKALKCFTKLKKFYKRKICLSCYPKFLTEQKTEWCKKEHNSNMNYRIKKSLAARLRTILVSKNDSTMTYIGCNIQYLREWFEFNFTSEMNWENYGTYWSIDHIIPACKFDLSIEDEKFKCSNWSNLMPVTIKFNSSKKQIDMEQINYIIGRIEKFKEEGSTTKWFSKEFILNKELALMKENKQI
jgi:hypothetical protein